MTTAIGMFGLVLAYLSIPASVLPVVPGRGLLLGLGVLLLGLAAFRTRLLGRWRAVPASLGALVIVVSVVYGPGGRLIGLPPLTPALGQSLGVPVGLPMVFPGLCWVLLGVSMWAYAPRREKIREARSTPATPPSG